MRTVDYSDILEGTAALPRVPRSVVPTELFGLWRTYHNRHFQIAWEIEEWPDVVTTEQRWFRDNYDAAVTYAAPTSTAASEVFYPVTQKYYQALRSTLNHAPANSDGTTNTAYWADSTGSYSGDTWAASTSYAVGTIVRNPSDYRFYQCHTAHTSGASFDATKFGILTPFDRYIGWTQTGKTAIGEFLNSWDKDPRITTRLTEYTPVIDGDGAHYRAGIVTVWLKFRKRRSELKGDKLDTTLVYTSGQQVFYTTSAGVSNFYDVTATTTAGDTPESASSKFSVVAIPYIFRGYLIQAGYADFLKSDAPAQAGAELAMAEQQLSLEVDKFRRQEKQTRRLNYQRNGL